MYSDVAGEARARGVTGFTAKGQRREDAEPTSTGNFSIIGMTHKFQVFSFDLTPGLRKSPFPGNGKCKRELLGAVWVSG